MQGKTNKLVISNTNHGNDFGTVTSLITSYKMYHLQLTFPCSHLVLLNRYKCINFNSVVYILLVCSRTHQWLGR